MISKTFSWIIACGIPLFVLLLGISGLWSSGNYLVDAYSSSNWPSTTGTIIRSDLGSRTISKQSSDRTLYWAEVEYEFEVNGGQYQSNHIRLDGLRSGPHVGTGVDHASKILANYPVGAEVNVFYDPNNPSKATLEAGFSSTNLLIPSFSLVLTMIGLFLLRWMIIFLVVLQLSAKPNFDCSLFWRQT